jgi:putative oxidoreductase
MKYLTLLGRILFSLIFLSSLTVHFSKGAIAYAGSQGVPLASIAVPFSGLMAFVGGLSIASGYKAKWGALLLVVFLIPVTIILHNFWAMKDAMMSQMQYAMFMKNISMLGAALLIMHFGSGPLSLDNALKGRSADGESLQENARIAA